MDLIIGEMRKVILINLLLIATITVDGQVTPNFDLTKNGVSPIILNIDSLDAKSIYLRAMNWIQETYKDPQKVLKANIQNEKVRVETYKSNAWYYMSLGRRYDYDMDYTFEIEFKDGKVRLTYTPGQFWVQGKRGLTYESFYKSSGELRQAYKEGEISLEASMNELKDSLYNYLTKKKKSDNW